MTDPTAGGEAGAAFGPPPPPDHAPTAPAPPEGAGPSAVPADAAPTRTQAFRDTVGATVSEQLRATSGHLAPVAAAPNQRDWNVINELLIRIQKDPSMVGVTEKLVLTRDHALDVAQMRGLEEAMRNRLQTWGLNPPSAKAWEQVVEAVYDELTGISVLGPLWRDDRVTEICIDAWDKIVVEIDGRLHLTPVRFRDLQHAEDIVKGLAQQHSDRALNVGIPLVTAELDRARAALMISSIVGSGLAGTIRKFPEKHLDIAELLDKGALDVEMVDFLRDCTEAEANVLISGSTGSGKTTMINALSGFIGDDERVITIEDSYELRLENRMWLPMQARAKASADDKVSVTLSDLLTHTLRMRPDRIVVGEIREAEAATTFLQAANTGHDGSMTTIHANSPADAIDVRLANLVAAGLGYKHEQAIVHIASAVDLIIQVTRARAKGRHSAGRRFISEIAVVDPSFTSGGIPTRTLFRGHATRSTDGTIDVAFTKVGAVPAGTTLAGKLSDYGLDRWVED